jgi:hypothetical protein
VLGQRHADDDSGRYRAQLAPGQRTAIVWLAVYTAIVALILFALAPVNDCLTCSSVCWLCTSFASPSEIGLARAHYGAAFWCLLWRRLSYAR